MKLPKSLSPRRLFLKSNFPVRFQQKRWARIQEVRYLATQTASERILDRYKDKLGKKAQEEGLRDINSLREAYKSKIDSLRKDAAIKLPVKQVFSTESQSVSNQPFIAPPPPSPPTPKSQHPQSNTIHRSIETKAPPGVKTLSSFIDVDKTSKLPAKDIEYIWRLRHASNSSSLCAVIPAASFAHIALTARKHPQFILPVPREGQGAEMHFLQWTFPHTHVVNVLFTSLAEYKLRGEFASPHTTVSMHTELVKDNGLVLAQGYVMDNRGVSIEDGKWLFMCLQKFYGLPTGSSSDMTRRSLLEQFTRGDEGFEIQKLLNEAEKLD